jgi:hypothetical protein
MISAKASTAHHEQLLHNSWEFKLQMLLEFQARNNHVRCTQGNDTQLLYSWVRNVRQLYNKNPQSYDPVHYKRLTELVFQYSLNRKHTTFSEGLVFLTEFAKQHGHCVVPTQYPQNQQLDHWAKYQRRESHKLFTTGTSKVKLEKAMELAALGLYKKKNGFECAHDVLDFYNKTFKKTSPVETEVILPRASAEVVHPQEMEPFALAEVTDTQEAEEILITIVKPTKVIYGNTSIRIDISQTKKAPTQVQKPFAVNWEFAQKSRESPHKVEIPLLKQAVDIFVPDMNKRDGVAAAEIISSPFEKQLCDHKQVTQDIFRVKEGDSKNKVVPK